MKFLDLVKVTIRSGAGGNGAVSFRFRDGSQENGIPVGDAVERILTVIRDRVQV